MQHIKSFLFCKNDSMIWYHISYMICMIFLFCVEQISPLKTEWPFYHLFFKCQGIITALEIRSIQLNISLSACFDFVLLDFHVWRVLRLHLLSYNPASKRCNVAQMCGCLCLAYGSHDGCGRAKALWPSGRP